MDVLPMTALHQQLRDQFESLGFSIEESSHGLWAARRYEGRRWFFGSSAVTYCITCILDERARTVRVWDAALVKRRGIALSKGSAARAAHWASIRSTLHKLAENAGWELTYGFGGNPMRAPRVFQA